MFILFKEKNKKKQYLKSKSKKWKFKISKWICIKKNDPVFELIFRSV